jgi:hypothetical protein
MIFFSFVAHLFILATPSTLAAADLRIEYLNFYQQHQNCFPAS